MTHYLALAGTAALYAGLGIIISAIVARLGWLDRTDFWSRDTGPPNAGDRAGAVILWPLFAVGLILWVLGKLSEAFGRGLGKMLGDNAPVEPGYTRPKI